MRQEEERNEEKAYVCVRERERRVIECVRGSENYCATICGRNREGYWLKVERHRYVCVSEKG